MISQSCPRAYLFFSASCRSHVPSTPHRHLALPIYLDRSAHLRGFHASSRYSQSKPGSSHSKSAWKKAVKPQKSGQTNSATEEFESSQSQTPPPSPSDDFITKKFFPDPLNPVSTVPPPLDIPRREDFEATWRYWLASGKAYAAFYKTSIKQVWYNRKTLKVLPSVPPLIHSLEKDKHHHSFSQPSSQDGQGTQEYLQIFSPLSLDGQVNFSENGTQLNRKFIQIMGNDDYSQSRVHPGTANFPALESAPGKDERTEFTRAEYQFVRRTRRDILKLIPFGFMVLILGEWTPLIVLAVSSIVPRICWIPAQEKKELKTLETRRTISLDHDKYVYALVRKGSPKTPFSLNSTYFVGRRLSNELLNVNWSRYSPRFVVRSKFPRIFNRLLTAREHNKLDRKLRYLDIDDALIRRHGGVPRMSIAEVKLAAAERSINVLDREERALRRDLHHWVEQGGWRTILNHSQKLRDTDGKIADDMEVYGD